MDNIEKHIRQNLSQFDQEKADRSKIWANINEALQQNSPQEIPFRRRPIFRIAASLLLIIGLAGLTGIYVLGKNEPSSTEYTTNQILEIDKHYRGLVAYQVDLLEKEVKLSADDKAEFLTFMKELDDEYRKLKEETSNNVNNKKVLQAIVANYKKRIELIEDLLKQLNEVDTKANNDDYIL
ncbi:hypothetical protein [Maribacter sp. Asnod1-A12]|uniref:hypothetical protein n=1 Tax=Maribacter sp. Asnod1-A12 TaxID=3160576 RepID=UPI0038698EE8